MKWKPYALIVVAVSVFFGGIYSIFFNRDQTNKEVESEFKTRGKTESTEESYATPEDKQELKKKVGELKGRVESGDIPSYYVKQNPVPYEEVSEDLKRFNKEHGSSVKVSLVLQPDGKIFKNNYQILTNSGSEPAISELSKILGGKDSARHVERKIMESSGLDEIQISGSTVKVQSMDSLKYDFDAFYSPELMKRLLAYSKSSVVRAKGSNKMYTRKLPLLIIDPSGRIISFTVVDQTKSYAVVAGEIPRVQAMIKKYANCVSRGIGMQQLQDKEKLKLLEMLQKEHTKVSDLQKKASRKSVPLNTFKRAA